MKDVPKKAKTALQTWANLIAMQVRNEMEDFHCQHLSDAQMKELNPLIRKAIYQTLRQLYFLKKGTKKQRLLASHLLHHLLLLLPNYWEVPDLSEQDRLDEETFSDMKSVKSLALFGSERSLQAFRKLIEEQIGVFD